MITLICITILLSFVLCVYLFPFLNPCSLCNWLLGCWVGKQINIFFIFIVIIFIFIILGVTIIFFKAWLTSETVLLPPSCPYSFGPGSLWPSTSLLAETVNREVPFKFLSGPVVRKLFRLCFTPEWAVGSCANLACCFPLSWTILNLEVVDGAWVVLVSLDLVYFVFFHILSVFSFVYFVTK
jgi:hypothetical protein